MRSWKQKIGLGLLCGALAFAAGAEMLVMKDGSRVETRGAFEVKGRRVVFQDVQGKLLALRLDEVDLAATEAASRPAPPPEATAASAASPAPKKAPVLVLTDRDVSHVDPSEVVAAPIVPRVVMYSTSWCGYCRKMRALLGELAIDFTELDIEKSAAARSAKNQLDSSCGVPLVDYGGQVICGFAEARIRDLAEKSAKQAAKAEKLAAEKLAAASEMAGGEL